MRTAVFLIAGLQIFLFVYLSITATGGSDAAGNAMSQGFLALGGIVMAILLVPALILAIVRRAEGFALALAILSLVVVFGGLSIL